ncbi:MAG: hypothetical protein IJY69_06030 [Clostridia bacterium]|nr:hypothetical protein [Clostridia bacterium]
MIYEIICGDISAKINTLGAELISLKKNGTEYMWDADKRYWDSSAPVLFPVCGRLLDQSYTYKGKEYKMDPHGFAPNSEFSPTRVEKNRLTLSLCSDENTKKIYPFDFELIADFELEDDLAVTFTVRNTGDDVLPYMMGWHPGFYLHGDGEINSFSLKFNAGETLLWYPLQNGCFVRPYGEDYAAPNGTYQLSEDEIYSNDTMIFCGTGGKALLSSPDTKYGLEISYSENLPYFCIWKETDSKARFICLEPWSDVPAGGDVPECFDDRRMSRLPSGDSSDYSYRVRLI